ncbi:MAG: ABC transporter permease subunit, partial [Deltaproteobacteria bacterium]|nr:ABC transporter permease subunit [Deltaproteobacteria bacterium]
MIAMAYQWDFSAVWDYRWALASGLATTLLLTGITIIVGTIIGIVLGVIQAARLPRILRWPINIYVEILRALPVLVLLVWSYYFLPMFTGVGLSAFA